MIIVCSILGIWLIITIIKILTGNDSYENSSLNKENEDLISNNNLPPISKLSLNNIINNTEGIYTIDNIKSIIVETGSINLGIPTTQKITVSFKSDTVYFDSLELKTLLKSSEAIIRRRANKDGDLIMFLRDPYSPEYSYDSSIGEEVETTDFVFFIKQYSFHIINVTNGVIFKQTNYNELEISHIK